MKLPSLFFVLFLFLSLSSFSQTKSMLIGSWQYKALASEQNQELNDLQKFYLDKMLNGFTIQLDESGRYRQRQQNMEGEKISYGDWSVNKEITEMYDESDDGSSSSSKILKLTADELILDIDNINVVMGKIDETFPIPGKKELKGIATTKSQITKKWYVKKVLKPGQSYEEGKSGQDATYEFRADGTYTYAVFGLEANGTWTLDENLGRIDLEVNGKKKVYLVTKITDTELRMQRGAGDTIFAMESKP